MMPLMVSIWSLAEMVFANDHLADGATGVVMSSRGCFPPRLVLCDGHRSMISIAGAAGAADDAGAAAMLDEYEDVLLLTTRCSC